MRVGVDLSSINAAGVEDQWAWADRGSCQGREDLFYNNDEDSKGVRRDKERLAKQICQQCPVIVECGQHAASARELYGVWGGLSEMERHNLEGRLRTG